MRCPTCGDLRDRVVDSRQTEDGRSIRRRRQCESCGGRYTTFERVETAAVHVRKRDGEVEPFDASKVAAGVSAACKSRPVDPGQIAVLVAEVEDVLQRGGKEVTSDEVGLEVLVRLRALDGVAAVRFASVYKGFDNVSDFEREIRLLQEAGAGRQAPHHRDPAGSSAALDGIPDPAAEQQSVGLEQRRQS